MSGFVEDVDEGSDCDCKGGLEQTFPCSLVESMECALTLMATAMNIIMRCANIVDLGSTGRGRLKGV